MKVHFWEVCQRDLLNVGMCIVIELLIKYCINEIIFLSSVYLGNYRLDVVANGVTFLLIFVVIVVEYAYFIPLNKAILF